MYAKDNDCNASKTLTSTPSTAPCAWGSPEDRAARLRLARAILASLATDTAREVLERVERFFVMLVALSGVSAFAEDKLTAPENTESRDACRTVIHYAMRQCTDDVGPRVAAAINALSAALLNETPAEATGTLREMLFAEGALEMALSIVRKLRRDQIRRRRPTDTTTALLVAIITAVPKAHRERFCCVLEGVFGAAAAACSKASRESSSGLDEARESVSLLVDDVQETLDEATANFHFESSIAAGFGCDAKSLPGLIGGVGIIDVCAHANECLADALRFVRGSK